MSKVKKVVKKGASSLNDARKDFSSSINEGFKDYRKTIFDGLESGVSKLDEIGDRVEGAPVEGKYDNVAPTAPPVAPVLDDEEAQMRKERELARRSAGAGRAGTALTEGSKLG